MPVDATGACATPRPRARPGPAPGAEFERDAERGKPTLVDGDERALDAGPVPGGRDARHRRAHPLVEAGDRTAAILVFADRAAGESQELHRWQEAVSETECVALDPLLGSGDHAPAVVNGGVDDRLDATVTLGGDDDPPVAQRDPSTDERQPVARRVAQQRARCRVRLRSSPRCRARRAAGRPRRSARSERRRGEVVRGTPMRPDRCPRRRSAGPAVRWVFTSV